MYLIYKYLNRKKIKRNKLRLIKKGTGGTTTKKPLI